MNSLLKIKKNSTKRGSAFASFKFGGDTSGAAQQAQELRMQQLRRKFLEQDCGIRDHAWKKAKGEMDDDELS